MARPTIAPPIRPAATPAATPRCALAGVAASEPAIVATAIKAANVLFMSWALLEVAPNVGAGVKLTQNTAFQAGRLAKKRTTVNPRQRPRALLDWKRRLFQASFAASPRKRLDGREPALI